MKRFIAVAAWAFLMVYGIYYSIFVNPGSTFLADLFQGNADPFAFMMFNLLGMIPLAFVVYFTQYYALKWFHYVILFSSFAFGGFGLGLIFFVFPEEKPLKENTRLAVAGLVITVAVLFYGLGFGSITSYVESFRGDTFIHVMTVDFFVLFIFYLALPKFNRSLLQVFFVPAMYVQLLLKDVQ